MKLYESGFKKWLGWRFNSKLLWWGSKSLLYVICELNYICRWLFGGNGCWWGLIVSGWL